MRPTHRPSSQPKIRSINSQIIPQTTLTNLKTQLQSTKQFQRFQKDVDDSDPIFEFLKCNNLQQFYKQVCQLCNHNYKELLQLKQINSPAIPAGFCLKLQKAIQLLKSNEVQQQNKQVEVIQVEEKQCCWICYQLIYKSVEFYGKQFCTNTCRDIYKREITIKCKRCGNGAIKFDAINSYGEWYCKQQCVFSDEELLMSLIQKKININ